MRVVPQAEKYSKMADKRAEEPQGGGLKVIQIKPFLIIYCLQGGYNVHLKMGI